MYCELRADIRDSYDYGVGEVDVCRVQASAIAICQSETIVQISIALHKKSSGADILRPTPRH